MQDQNVKRFIHLNEKIIIINGTKVRIHLLDTAIDTVLFFIGNMGGKTQIFVACCLISGIDFAIPFSFGTLYLHLLAKYGESRAATATVQSIFVGTTSCSGKFLT